MARYVFWTERLGSWNLPEPIRHCSSSMTVWSLSLKAIESQWVPGVPADPINLIPKLSITPLVCIIMLTDGVTDVMNEMPQPTAFGRKRLTGIIESMNTSDPRLVVSRIMQ